MSDDETSDKSKQSESKKGEEEALKSMVLETSDEDPRAEVLTTLESENGSSDNTESDE
ncbi:hypothetical protein [Natrinema sp. SYSU A 869]|uniref:hypothetical protein n=1 Tax=Natrinema sp. SYSU A 869 TaxID=2871694 RepID=UPI001CA46619|nr:hypothetical protein [Natrinema sp. SYSU A 869]